MFAKNTIRTCCTAPRTGARVHTDVLIDLGIDTEKKQKKKGVLEKYFTGATRTGWAAIGTVP